MTNHHSKIINKNGSALVAVLVIMAIALLAITIIMQNVLVDTSLSFNLKKSDEAYNNAVSAIEEATLRLIREPVYTSEVLNFSDGNATININHISDSQKEITVLSRVKNNQYVCQLKATVFFNESGVLSVNNIQEIY